MTVSLSATHCNPLNVDDEDYEWISEFTWNAEKADESYGAVFGPQIIGKFANGEVGR